MEKRYDDEYRYYEQMAMKMIFERLEKEGASVTLEEMKNELEKRLNQGDNKLYAREVMKGVLTRLTLEGPLKENFNSPNDITYYLK